MEESTSPTGVRETLSAWVLPGKVEGNLRGVF